MLPRCFVCAGRRGIEGDCGRLLGVLHEGLFKANGYEDNCSDKAKEACDNGEEANTGDLRAGGCLEVFVDRRHCAAVVAVAEHFRAVLFAAFVAVTS